MDIESELLAFLTEKIIDSDNKNRDINLIHYYYGFQEEVEPTLEKAAAKFNVGDTSKRKSERPRQIIKKHLKKIAKYSDFPSAIRAAELISSFGFINVTEIIDLLKTDGLIGSKPNFRGLLRILRDLNLVTNYDIYTPKLVRATKRLYFSNTGLFLIKAEKLSYLKPALLKARTLPGKRGIATISALKNEIGKEFKYLNEVIKLLRADPESWFYESKGETYYLIQNRDNTLINSMEKVSAVTESVELEKFVNALSKSIYRIPVNSRAPYEILLEYLKTSKYTKLVNENITLNLPSKGLTQIEQDLVEILKSTGQMDFPSISRNLINKEHGEHFIKKNVFSSALIYVDKSAGRGNYTFSLVKPFLKEHRQDFMDRYAEFARKLKALCFNGTDRELSINARLEQTTLREWLFGEKKTESCAICGEEYSIASLVAAHKKRRAGCSKSERTDPHIVMPLCLFGCDSMYERQCLKICEGQVQANVLSEYLTEKENSYIENVVGNYVELRWLEGNPAYFK